MPRTPLARITAGSIAIGLLCVAVLAGPARRADGGRSLHLPSLGPIVAIAGVAVAGLTIALLWVARGSSPRGEFRQRSPLHQLASLAALVLILFATAAVLDRLTDDDAVPPPSTEDAGADGSSTANPPAAESGSEGVWVVAILLAGLGMTLLAGRRLDRARPAADDHVAPAPAADVDDDDVAALRAIREPRLAVMAAYDAAERTLAFHGVPRRPSEVPREFLARTRRILVDSVGAMQTLTRLLERAMFSQHPVDERMKDDAIAAMLAVREELRAAAALAIAIEDPVGERAT